MKMRGVYWEVIGRNVLGAVLLAAMLLSLPAAFAEEVIRYVSFTSAGPEHDKELDKMAPAKIYAGTKGLVWIKFFHDRSTAERGSVSLWKSKGDLDAFLSSDAYKAIFPGKVKSHVKGDITVKVYPVVDGK
jgi:heme-degrading monooxygenase HmoA